MTTALINGIVQGEAPPTPLCDACAERAVDLRDASKDRYVSIYCFHNLVGAVYMREVRAWSIRLDCTPEVFELMRDIDWTAFPGARLNTKQ